jgi:ribonuclease BN (tRNA processing enzyme)
MALGIMTNYGVRSESIWLRESLRYIVDAGQGKLGEKLIEKFKGRKLHCFVISHGDSDHIALSKQIVQAFKPEVIVVSPVPFALDYLRYESNKFISKTFRVTNEADTRLPKELFEDKDYITAANLSDYKVNYEGNNYERLVPPVFLTRNQSIEPWATLIDGTTIPEFETFPTSSSIKWATLVCSFARNLSSSSTTSQAWKVISSTPFISELLNGVITDIDSYGNAVDIFKEIENGLLKKLRNDMSLICRVGKVVFLGDSTKVHLDEVFPALESRAKALSYDLTIKVSHHGSGKDEYRNINFYTQLKPIQLIQKRDDRVEKGKGFNTFQQSLNSIQTVQNFLDVQQTGSTPALTLFKF